MAEKFKQDSITVVERRLSSSTKPSISMTPTPTFSTDKTVAYETGEDGRPKPAFVRARSKCHDFLGEFMGTFIFLLIGFGVNAQSTLFDSKAGEWTTVVLGWSAGIATGIFVAGPSGGHLNPAVSIAMTIFRGFPLLKLPLYILAQTLGAFCAAGVVYANYGAAISSYEGGGMRTVGLSTSTAGLFGTYPQKHMNNGMAFADEFIGTALLLFGIFTLTSRSRGVPGPAVAPCVGMVFVGISAGFGWQTSFSINPARDFGPRLLTSMVGYGSTVWTANSNYAWIPIVAPALGGVTGGLLFDLLLGSDERSPVNMPYFGLKSLGRRRDSEDTITRMV